MSIASLTMEFKDATTPVNPAVPPTGGAELDATNLELIRAAINACVAQLNTQGELTAAGRGDANAIAAATGATLYARLFGILDATWGLGGQTPAPKPNTYTSGLTVGETIRLYSGENTALKTPNIAGGSSWRVTGITLQNTSTGVLNGVTSSSIANIYPGDSQVCAAASGFTGYADFWRIA